MVEKQWEPHGKPDAEVIRECAEVLFVPNDHCEQKAWWRYRALRNLTARGKFKD
jgi:hypothetical protein